MITEKVTLTGKLIEIGNVGEYGERGLVLESVPGAYYTLTGLSEDECRAIAPYYGQKIEFTIETNGDSTECERN